MADFSFNPLLDPARKKRAALKGAPGTSDYPNQVAEFNNWLYTPMDRRPSPTQPDRQYSADTAPGWHAPPQSNPIWSASSSPQSPAMGGTPTNAIPPGLQTDDPINTAPRATMPSTMGVPTPPQNAMQRWSGGSGGGDSDGGLRPISDARRYFWATGSIDARAPQADPTRNKGAVSSPNFNNEVPGHSNWQPGQAGFTFNAGNGHSQWSPW